MFLRPYSLKRMTVKADASDKNAETSANTEKIAQDDVPELVSTSAPGDDVEKQLGNSDRRSSVDKVRTRDDRPESLAGTLTNEKR